MLKWPDREAVHHALQQWAFQAGQNQPGIRKIGYFGSYARGDWGVGSDLDVLILMDQTDQPFEYRAAAFDTTNLSVPADVLVYTNAEWDRLLQQGPFFTKVQQEIVWVYER